jgi:hypothetical protein
VHGVIYLVVKIVISVDVSSLRSVARSQVNMYTKVTKEGGEFLYRW